MLQKNRIVGSISKVNAYIILILHRRIIIDNRMTSQAKNQIQKQLQQWEEGINKQDAAKNIPSIHKDAYKSKKTSEEQLNNQQIDLEQYFHNSDTDLNQKKQAENQRIKGNQAIRSRDYHQSIKYYTKCVMLDPSSYQAYGNRALAYLKLKQNQKALNDCEQAIRINPKYTKAYHRKAKSLIGLKNKAQAYKALQQGLKIEPENSELIGQLRDLRQQMGQSEIKQLQGPSQFKKIVIQEDSEDEEEQIVQK